MEQGEYKITTNFFIMFIVQVLHDLRMEKKSLIFMKQKSYGRVAKNRKLKLRSDKYGTCGKGNAWQST